MEFSDINLTKDSSLLLHAIHSPFYWRILKKTILFFGFKNTNKQSVRQENLSLSMNSILLNRKIRVENLSLRRLQFVPRNIEWKCRSRILSQVPQLPPQPVAYLGTGWEGKKLCISTSRVLYSKFSLVCSEKDRVTQTASFWPFLAWFPSAGGHPGMPALQKCISRPYVGSEANH